MFLNRRTQNKQSVQGRIIIILRELTQLHMAADRMCVRVCLCVSECMGLVYVPQLAAFCFNFYTICAYLANYH